MFVLFVSIFCTPFFSVVRNLEDARFCSLRTLSPSFLSLSLVSRRFISSGDSSGVTSLVIVLDTVSPVKFADESSIPPPSAGSRVTAISDTSPSSGSAPVSISIPPPSSGSTLASSLTACISSISVLFSVANTSANTAASAAVSSRSSSNFFRNATLPSTVFSSSVLVSIGFTDSSSTSSTRLSYSFSSSVLVSTSASASTSLRPVSSSTCTEGNTISSPRAPLTYARSASSP